MVLTVLKKHLVLLILPAIYAFFCIHTTHKSPNAFLQTVDPEYIHLISSVNLAEGNLNLQKFNSSECVSQGKIDGILATNATQFSPTPPVYIESSQELSYQLAAPHFIRPNEEFKGTYSLVVSEKLAHCIWGKSLTNASARVTILNPDGKTSVVTQTLKRLSGFYYFNINGFGFSAPTIRIKLTQDANTKTTITCVKGKLSKKVTAVKPICPTGYKKK